MDRFCANIRAMNLSIFGINHKTAPIDIREKFYLTDTEQDLLLSELKNDPIFLEAFVLSTCNRTEVTQTLSINSIRSTAFLKFFLI